MTEMCIILLRIILSFLQQGHKLLQYIGNIVYMWKQLPTCMRIMACLITCSLEKNYSHFREGLSALLACIIITSVDVI